jgi:hypothetical protein
MVDQEEVVQIPAARTCAAAGSPNTVMDQNQTSGPPHGSSPWHIRSDGGRPPTVGRLRAVGGRVSVIKTYFGRRNRAARLDRPHRGR